MQGVNLLAKVLDKSTTRDGKTHYVDVQVDARDPRVRGQTNLHLKSEPVQGADGKRRFNNDLPYSVRQLQEMAEAAGENHEPVLNKDGQKIGTLYGFKSDVMPAMRATGLVVKTKSAQPSDFRVDDKTLDNQFDSMRAAREARNKATAAQASAPAAEQTVEAVQPVAMDEPAVG
ncbi:hypothetical protein HUW46_09121 [Amycolatopsis sp. CA-230715]|nr:hypothetical protein HUW46_09121 [Amycolatopsis sp. CA-230715]